MAVRRVIALELPRHAEMARRMLAFLVVAGLALQFALPGFDLALRAQDSWLALVTKGAVCHSPQSSEQPLPAGGEDRSHSDGCCLVCQAVQLAKGILPSPTFTLPTAGTALSFGWPAISANTSGHASRHKQARAPPAP
ncbi:MAG: hypothetical protein HYU60_05780 [Magnetospirillum sp.]|nr:hypothetical protein [Magnetospirillum sp.]